MTITQYLVTNIYMGAGIAADVYAATIGSFRDFGNDTYRANWVRRNTITHTVFPFLGVYSVVIGIAAWSLMESLLFAFGAVLLGMFLWKLVREKAGLNRLRQTSDVLNTNKINIFSRFYNRFVCYMGKIDPQWPLVLAVSVDAINSGFAKAADTKDWSLPALLFSFPLVGFVVGTGAWLGGQKARWFSSFFNEKPLKKGFIRSWLAKHNNNWLLSFLDKEPELISVDRLVSKLTQLEFAALLAELLVLGYFFWRSVASAIVSSGFIEWSNSRVLSWGMSGGTVFIILALFGSKIALHINKESEESFTDHSLESVTEHQLHRSRAN
jgi:hypothetical protein